MTRSRGEQPADGRAVGVSGGAAGAIETTTAVAMTGTAAGSGAAAGSGWLSPERVARAEFRTSFRGLDATEVRSFLARVANELRGMVDAQTALQASLDAAERRPLPSVSQLTAREITELLGAETARVLDAAREAAADMRAAAHADATATMEAAAAEADRLRSEAESVLGERTAEADAEADRIRSEAREEAASIVADAETIREQARLDAEAHRDAARAEGRRMVAEARAVRERILTDMARRRNVARQNLERVRAARERLLEAIETVRSEVTDAQAELNGSLVEAKLAGERAARAVDVDDLPSIMALEAEVETAKDAGLIKVDPATIAAFGDASSPIDTGEFAAVTAPEPENEVVAASKPVPRRPVEPVVVRDEPEPEAAATPPAEVTSAEVTSATDEVIDLTKLEAASAATPEAAAGPDDGEPSPGGGASPAPSAPVRSGTRRGRSPRPSTELFARIRSTSDEPVANGTTMTAERPVSGSHAAGADASSAMIDAPSTVAPSAVAPAAAPSKPAETAEAAPAAEAAEPAADAEPAPVNEDRVALHQRDATVAANVRDLSRQLKLALSDQQNALLEAVRGPKGKATTATTPELPGLEELRAPYVAAAIAELRAAALAGVRAVASADTEAPVPATVDRDVERQAHTLATAIVETIREKLDRSDGAGGALEGPHAADRVRASYREIRNQRLGELAEYHVLLAYGTGQLAAAPKDATVRWVHANCGPDCLDNALAGEVAVGTTFPTGHPIAPGFVGCRCLLVVSTGG